MPGPYYADLLPYPPSIRALDLQYPDAYRTTRFDTLSRVGSYESRRRRRKREPEPQESKTPYDISQDLQDPELKHHGDLGWTLDFATAYCYKHIVSNAPSIIDTIDTLRRAPAAKLVPFRIFDQLDKALFLHKLKGMVFLRWKTQSDNSPGVTCKAGNVCPRVTIELNSTPIKKGDAHIDDLLEQMIHQMIHAYFLICCGAQDSEVKQDGRLLDGIQFGVILMAINDITRDCKDGGLRMRFHASRRGQGTATRAVLRRLLDDSGSSTDGRSFIAVDPHGNTGGAPPPDGRSHCTHDNRYIRRSDVVNWQVQDYSRCIDLALDSKGGTIYDLNEEGKLAPTDRLKGPPSSTYIELIWDSKRVMIPREKALAFPSLKKLAVKFERYECVVPECEFQVFKCLWDFIQHRKYAPSIEDIQESSFPSTYRRTGPPVILGHGRGQEQPDGITTHIRVFKLAEGLYFEELRNYARDRLFSMSRTIDDPITALEVLYKGSIHGDLHKWARAFLARTDDRFDEGYGYGNGYGYASTVTRRGLSNYEILLQTHRERFESLYHSNAALKDDCKLVVAELTYPGRLDDNAVLGHDTGTTHAAYQIPNRAPLAIGGYAPRPLIAAAPYGRRRSYDDLYDPAPALIQQPVYAPAGIVPIRGERLAIMPPTVLDTRVIAAASYSSRRRPGAYGLDPAGARYVDGRGWDEPWNPSRYL